MKPIQTTNANARQYVQRREDFRASNTFALTLPPVPECLTYRYVVFSYGEHYPLFIAEWLPGGPDGGKVQWYVNRDNYSITTSKHRTQLNPLDANILPMTTDAMKTIANYGTAGLAVMGEYDDVPF